MIENALLLNEILRAVLVDSGLHWFEVWRLRAVCRAFHRLSKAVLPEVMIKNCAAYPVSKVFACAHDLENAAPPLLHVHSSSELDDDKNVYLKPVKWDPEAETLLFLPAAVDVRSHDPTCSKCEGVKKLNNEHNQRICGHLFEDETDSDSDSEQQHEATIVGRCHGHSGSRGLIRFEGWNKVRFTQWDPIERDPTDHLRHAWIKAKDEQGGTLDTPKPCVYRDSDKYSHPAIRMVYSVVEMEEYLTTGNGEQNGSVHSEDSEFYYTVEYKILEALVSFPWVLHGFVSSYVPPPTFLAKRLRRLVAVCDTVIERGLLPLHDTKAFFEDLKVEKNSRAFVVNPSFVVKRNNCRARTADLIVRGREAPFDAIEKILEDNSLSESDAEKEAHDYFAKTYLWPKTSKYMWKVGMSIGLVDWIHATPMDADLVFKAIKWANWELSSEKTYSYEYEPVSELFIVLLAHFILTPGAIAELVRHDIAAQKAGRSHEYGNAISWEFFHFCLESKLDDMNTLLGLGIQAISAYCWDFDYFKRRHEIFWDILMKSGTAHVKALLKDSRNEFKPDAWRVFLNDLGSIAIRELSESSGAETSWRVLVDLDLLDWEEHGEEYLTTAISLQVDVCIDDLLDKGIVSHKALSEIFSGPRGFLEEYQQRNNPNMALFNRLVNNPLFYTDRAWAAAAAVLVRPPLESGREALELLVHRPLLTAPTPELIMSLASFGETHPGNPANAILPQIIQLIGKEKVRNLALEFWEVRNLALEFWPHENRFSSPAVLRFKRLIEGTIFLHKSFGINTFEKERFLTMAAYYYDIVMRRGNVSSTDEVDWIERGAFHDIDEHGHSDFAETLLSGMGYAPPRSDTLKFQLFYYFLRILTTHRIRIKDRSAFLSALLLSAQSREGYLGRDVLKMLFHQQQIASAADVTMHPIDISMMSHTGQYDIPLTPSLLVAACITSGQSFLRVILDSGIRLQVRYESSRGLDWITEALAFLGGPSCVEEKKMVDTSSLIAHVSEFLDHCRPRDAVMCPDMRTASAGRAQGLKNVCTLPEITPFNLKDNKKWILMEEITGRSLAEEMDKGKMKRQDEERVDGLMGNLKGAGDDGGVTFGPFVDGTNARGYPWRTYSEYVKSVLEDAIISLSTKPALCRNRHLDGSLPVLTDSTFASSVFTHGDLNARNILVHRDPSTKLLNLSGIVDFDPTIYCSFSEGEEAFDPGKDGCMDRMLLDEMQKLGLDTVRTVDPALWKQARDLDTLRTNVAPWWLMEMDVGNPRLEGELEDAAKVVEDILASLG
ncbi:hypothetical protein HDU87_008190 [Geranomyces variabilis]|uniref:Aminoglycoside phosphotransferase domain-containing protein n=1 Tax=Geranomyces variabilis TaxID=109894 RepID=A0AAD5TDM4_9FUNG|nr:hypothetical protein HDU87_008190 [Geranomyces variabilis]